jgi:hypothetical protein
VQSWFQGDFVDSLEKAEKHPQLHLYMCNMCVYVCICVYMCIHMLV